MSLTYHHEIVAPNLHRFLFASESRPDVQHELLLDLDAVGEGRLTCLCEASLYGKMCKHKRLVIRGMTGRSGFGRVDGRWSRVPPRRARARARMR